MPKENAVAVARRGNAWFSSIPFETLRETLLEADDLDAAGAKLAELGAQPIDGMIDPDIEVDMSAFVGGAILAESGRGHSAFLRFWQHWLEPWEDLAVATSDFQELGEHGEHAVVDAHVSARGRLGGVPAELSVCQLWTVRDGRAIRYSVFPTRDEALAALEIEEAGET